MRNLRKALGFKDVVNKPETRNNEIIDTIVATVLAAAEQTRTSTSFMLKSASLPEHDASLWNIVRTRLDQQGIVTSNKANDVYYKFSFRQR